MHPWHLSEALKLDNMGHNLCEGDALGQKKYTEYGAETKDTVITGSMDRLITIVKG